MKIQLNFVSAAVAGDYYQVLFMEKEQTSEHDIMNSKYVLIQRQFELADDDRIYVESHDKEVVGEFKVICAKLSPTCLYLKLSRNTLVVIEITFQTSPKNYLKVKRVLRVIIPTIEFQNEDQP